MSKADKRQQAITNTIETHEDGILAMIRRRIRDEVEAQDIAQEVFEEYIEAYDLDQVFDSIGAWLSRVAQNKVLDRFRRRKTETGYITSVTQAPTDETSADRPDEDWTRSLIREEITLALELLPPEQREVFFLHELEGKSFEEISNLTGRNVNTLLSQKRYAIIFLRDYLQEVYDELE